MCGNDVNAVVEETKKATDGNINLSTPLDAINSIINVSLQASTSGLVGYKDGKISKGVTTELGLEGLGEVTGRNAARKANMDATAALAEEKRAKAKQLSDEQKRKGELDVQASQTAAALRSSASQQQSNSLGGGAAGMTRDFLGL